MFNYDNRQYIGNLCQIYPNIVYRNGIGIGFYSSGNACIYNGCFDGIGVFNASGYLYGSGDFALNGFFGGYSNGSYTGYGSFFGPNILKPFDYTGNFTGDLNFDGSGVVTGNGIFSGYGVAIGNGFIHTSGSCINQTYISGLISGLGDIYGTGAIFKTGLGAEFFSCTGFAPFITDCSQIGGLNPKIDYWAGPSCIPIDGKSTWTFQANLYNLNNQDEDNNPLNPNPQPNDEGNDATCPIILSKDSDCRVNNGEFSLDFKTTDTGICKLSPPYTYFIGYTPDGLIIDPDTIIDSGENIDSSYKKTITGVAPGVYGFLISGQLNTTQMQISSIGRKSTSINALSYSTESSDGCITQNGSLSVTWDGDYGYSSPFGGGFSTTGFSVQNIGAGSYDITIGDGWCTYDFSIDIEPKNPLNGYTTNTTGVSCSGNTLGATTIIAEGGYPPYSYYLNNIPTGSGISGLNLGTYGIRISDSSGCNFLTTIDIGQNIQGLSAYAAVVSPNGNRVCCQAENEEDLAHIFTIVNGGQYPYTYLWNNGETTPDITVGGGTYYVTVTDANGCSTSTVNYPVNIEMVADCYKTHWDFGNGMTQDNLLLSNQLPMTVSSDYNLEGWYNVKFEAADARGRVGTACSNFYFNQCLPEEVPENQENSDSTDTDVPEDTGGGGSIQTAECGGGLPSFAKPTGPIAGDCYCCTPISADGQIIGYGCAGNMTKEACYNSGGYCSNGGCPGLQTEGHTMCAVAKGNCCFGDGTSISDISYYSCMAKKGKCGDPFWSSTCESCCDCNSVGIFEGGFFDFNGHFFNTYSIPYPKTVNLGKKYGDTCCDSWCLRIVATHVSKLPPPDAGTNTWIYHIPIDNSICGVFHLPIFEDDCQIDVGLGCQVKATHYSVSLEPKFLNNGSLNPNYSTLLFGGS